MCGVFDNSMCVCSVCVLVYLCAQNQSDIGISVLPGCEKDKYVYSFVIILCFMSLGNLVFFVEISYIKMMHC